MSAFLIDWIGSIWMVLGQSGPYLLVGFAIAGYIKAVVPEAWVYRHMGGDDFKSVAVASCCGVPIPLCSCSVIPTAIALKNNGASKGATTSFLISTPETGVDSIGVTWALMDPLMTIARPVAALFTALFAGQLVNLLVRRGLDDTPPGLQVDAAGNPRAAGEDPTPGIAESCCHDDPPAIVTGAGGPDAATPVPPAIAADDHDHDHDHDHDQDAPVGVHRRALRYAFGTLLDDLTPWFIVGFLVSGLIMVLMPDDFFGDTLTPGFPTMLLMLVIGVPMYICATASTPVAAALIAKGLDPGAALILLLAGPATNVATILVVRRFLGKRVLVIYLASIAGASLFLGWLVNQLYVILKLDTANITSGSLHDALSPIAIAGGVALTALLVISSLRQGLPARITQQARRALSPFGLDPGSRLAVALYVILGVSLYASTAVTIVPIGETAFLTRFGRLVEEWSTPGVRVHAPYPFSSVERLRHAEIRTTTIGAREVKQDPALRRLVSFDDERELEAEVLSGDEYMLRVSFAVLYQPADARQVRFGVSDPEACLRAAAESSLRHVFGTRTADGLMIGGFTELEDAVTARLSDELRAIRSGLTCRRVRLLSVHAPDEVHDAFRDVASSLEDKLRRIRRGERYRAENLADARARAHRLVQQAEGARTTTLEKARGDVAAFVRVEAANAESPDVNRLRLRLDAAAKALAGARLILNLDKDVDLILVGKDTGPGAPPRAPGEDD